MTRHEAQVEISKVVHTSTFYEGGGRCEIAWGIAPNNWNAAGRTWEEAVAFARKLLRESPEARTAALGEE